VDATNASIVLSSTWRTSPVTTRLVNEELTSLGLQACISATPDFSGFNRTHEILTWLQDHKDMVKNWVALDDIDLSHYDVRIGPHFVHCESSIGLTHDRATKAIEYLLNPKQPPILEPLQDRECKRLSL